ncbi:hypothetical protein OCU04_003069 [Sclerotinia nivalis]|uniref:Uncharacterized protein n=1 Tax=Sclerotinia nivalis TaxID=352851 RepID=A0A9X0AUY3_9HELO|nr:hypothetical protein OCU04_003069 [Sclerotinia nivalis]
MTTPTPSNPFPPPSSPPQFQPMDNDFTYYESCPLCGANKSAINKNIASLEQRIHQLESERTALSQETNSLLSQIAELRRQSQSTSLPTSVSTSASASKSSSPFTHPPNPPFHNIKPMSPATVSAVFEHMAVPGESSYVSIEGFKYMAVPEESTHISNEGFENRGMEGDIEGREERVGWKRVERTLYINGMQMQRIVKRRDERKRLKEKVRRSERDEWDEWDEGDEGDEGVEKGG